ncbi:uncharacterized protein LOC106060725 [Biomphalaria glabrata]|uniref:Uncharacterized protein LOC106060725 n=1 Tax=Biomphalaria glabrata TaxID=6526 RepID=A0A9W3A4R0_BIOGL|nr:uncharacterized protein LOC106060725 [Biomphalaria glabrata]
MAESGQETSMSACRCVQCIQNWTTQSSALRVNTVTTNQRRSSYPVNSYTYSAALTFIGSPNHLYNEYPSGSFQTQMSSYVLPSYATPIFRNTYGQMYNDTYSRPSPARGPAEIRFYTPSSSRTWSSPDTFEGLHRQTTPETVALSDPNNWIYRINYFIPSETRTSTSAPQWINNTMPLNDLTEIRQTLDVISSESTFPTQLSSTPSSNLLSSNNPPSLMSSNAPNSGSTFPTQLSSTPSSNLLSPNNSPSLMSSTAPNSGSTFPTQPSSTPSSNLLSSNNSPSLMSSTAPNSGSTFPTQPSSTPSSNLLSSNNSPSLMSSTAPNSGSTFPTQPSSTPSSNLLSSNNPPSLMSSTAPNTSQLSLNITSATVQESSIDSSNQFTFQFNNNTNELMASAMDYTEGNSESETEIDRNLPEEVSMPEKEIIDRRKQLCPHNDTDECDDDCPYRHGRLCHLCLTHRLNPYNPELHADLLTDPATLNRWQRQ